MSFCSHSNRHFVVLHYTNVLLGNTSQQVYTRDAVILNLFKLSTWQQNLPTPCWVTSVIIISTFALWVLFVTLLMCPFAFMISYWFNEVFSAITWSISKSNVDKGYPVGNVANEERRTKVTLLNSWLFYFKLLALK